MDVLPDNRTHHILSTFCRNNSTASSAVFPDRLYQLIRSVFFQQLKRLWVVVQRQQPQFTFVKYVLWQWLNRQPIRELIVSRLLRLYFSSSDRSRSFSNLMASGFCCSTTRILFCRVLPKNLSPS
jgi:hypothetical protein